MKFVRAILIVALFAMIIPSVNAASFTLSPSANTVKIGDTFTVDVNLDTAGAQIDGFDIRYLVFNPSLLQIVDSDSAVQGVQVAAHTNGVLSLTLSNTVDNAVGTLLFSQVVQAPQNPGDPPNRYTGTATVATITFQALNAGSSDLKFDFTPGSTTDSNVAASASDILTSAPSQTITILTPTDFSAQQNQQNTNPSNPSTSSGTSFPLDYLLMGIGVVVIIILIAIVLRHRSKVPDGFPSSQA
jgi:hypothetical protein